jgi:hypothetical protein
VETNTRQIVARLEREPWARLSGGSYNKFTHAARESALIIVPRHQVVSPSVARDIAEKAGWT